MEFHIILDKPKVPENIGFICRCMKTTGMGQLHLINPINKWKQKSWMTAFQSQEFLEEAILHDNLESAVRHVDFVIGTSAKHRATRHEAVSIDDLSTKMKELLDPNIKVGIVMGNEESGLSNKQLALCDWISFIPIQTTYPSLNLSHATMMYCYECSKLIREESASTEMESEESSMMALKEKSEEILNWLEIDQHPLLYQRIKDKLVLASIDNQKLLLSTFRFLRRKMNNK